MPEIEGLDFVIREAKLIDVDGIAPLCLQLGYPCLGNEIMPRLEKLLGDEEHIIFVAQSTEGRIVGWIHSYIYKLFYADVMAEIGGIVVDENHRGMGIGKQLMKAVEEWAISKACLGVSLRSNSKRTGAHIFYSGIGYEKVKEQYTFRKYF